MTFCSLSYSSARMPRGDIPENTLDPDCLAIRAEQRRLHGLDVELVTLGGDMLFDDVENLSALDDAPIVMAILLGEICGKEVEVGLPLDRLESRAQFGAEFLVGEREAAFEILAENHLGKCLDQGVVEDLGPLESTLDTAPLGGRGAELGKEH